MISLASTFHRLALKSYISPCWKASKNARLLATVTKNQHRPLPPKHYTMATSSQVYLTVNDTGVVNFKSQSEEVALKTSELLQRNHEEHHVYFNHDGFHNHIVHHLLTLYGLGAPKAVIERAYATNASYQLPAVKVKENNVEAMHGGNFASFLGKGPRYSDFLTFFQVEIDKKGYEQVLLEYVFDGSEKAEDMLVRMFAGFLHPIIHLGFGLEFKQPAIIAEALAQAAVHDTWIDNLLLPAEQASKKNGNLKQTLPKLLEQVRNSKKVKESAHWDDANKLRDGVLARAAEDMIAIASQWVVTPETLEAKTVEMQTAAVYFAFCAQHPPKQVKIDFFYMHSVNCSIFWDTFNHLSFLTPEQKCRLLEWKGRADLAFYASRGSPALPLEEISMYMPKHLEAGDAEWPGLFRRMFEKDDDGHSVKLLRAVANAKSRTENYEDEDWCLVKRWMWDKVGNMAVDSVEETTDNHGDWVRSCGFEEAWKDIGDRPRQAHI